MTFENLFIFSDHFRNVPKSGFAHIYAFLGIWRQKVLTTVLFVIVEGCVVFIFFCGMGPQRCLYTHTHTYTHTHVHTRTPAHAHTRSPAHPYTRAHAHTRTRAHPHTRAHPQTRTRAHTHK